MPQTLLRTRREYAARCRRVAMMAAALSAVALASYQMLDTMNNFNLMLVAAALLGQLPIETRTIPNTVFYECVGIWPWLGKTCNLFLTL
jgi:hypothetical protein